MENNNFVLEITEIDGPEIALDVLAQAITLGQHKGIYGLNDANKIHQSLVYLVKYFQKVHADEHEKADVKNE